MFQDIEAEESLDCFKHRELVGDAIVTENTEETEFST